MDFFDPQTSILHAEFVAGVKQVNEAGSIWQGNGNIKGHIRCGGVEQDDDSFISRRGAA